MTVWPGWLGGKLVSSVSTFGGQMAAQRIIPLASQNEGFCQDTDFYKPQHAKQQLLSHILIIIGWVFLSCVTFH